MLMRKLRRIVEMTLQTIMFTTLCDFNVIIVKTAITDKNLEWQVNCELRL